MNLLTAAFLPFHRCLPVLALGVATCAAPAWAGPPSVPFTARVTTQETLGYDPARCPVAGIVGTTVGTGQATHLGTVKMLAVDCLLLAPGTLPTFSNGVLTLTASNGDVLTAAYQGALNPVGDVADRYTIGGDFTVTGGTGRFAGAKGSGTLQGTITLGAAVSQAEYQVSGTLSY